jgi:hypothetical protein
MSLHSGTGESEACNYVLDLTLLFLDQESVTFVSGQVADISYLCQYAHLFREPGKLIWYSDGLQAGRPVFVSQLG